MNDLPSIWEKYHYHISELGLYNNSDVLADVLESMATTKVQRCREKESGTQIKVYITLDDKNTVLIKPQKTERDYETPRDHFYFVDFERHHAEIAAFHVDKLLNFYRTPPTVGRVFDMKHEIWEKADKRLAKTFFYSPVGNTCFTGHCSYYCDTTHAICGRPLNRMETSVQLMLPTKPLVEWSSVEHPYRRSYSKKTKANWESDNNYCYTDVFQNIELHNKNLLDIMDLSIFDFITGNMDRHHFERIIGLGNSTFFVHLDNGRSFGKQHHDEMSILAPIMQCCLVRYSTLMRLKYLYLNSFSKMLDDSMKSDPLYPILTTGHLKAVDRRLEIILIELQKCTFKHSIAEVVIDDGY